MIYLISGSPRSGKTILSKKLSQKLNIPYSSTDQLKLILRPYFNDKEREKVFPFDKIWKNLKLEDYFKNYTGRDMLNIDTHEAKVIWPGIKFFISRLIQDNNDYILEGVHLLPKYLKTFKDNPQVKIVLLSKVNEKIIYNGLFKGKNKQDWILDNIKDKEILKLVAKSLNVYGNYFKKETKKYNLKLINTESNFSEQINKAIKFLTR